MCVGVPPTSTVTVGVDPLEVAVRSSGATAAVPPGSTCWFIPSKCCVAV
jgi:hypothetical protein